MYKGDDCVLTAVPNNKKVKSIDTQSLAIKIENLFNFCS